MMDIFNILESNVRSYSRSFPAVFKRAKNALLYDDKGKKYIDFFSGAGSLNYGHNPSEMTTALIDYLKDDGICLSLDKMTCAKRAFLEKFSHIILMPRNMEYKIQFTGPTGANAIEAALKLSRIVKKRRNVIAFTNGYHGLSQGALSITSNSFYRNDIFLQDSKVTFMPYDKYFCKDSDTSVYLRKMLEDPSSGIDLPSAIILETIQAEGGVNVACREWLRKIQQICTDLDILMIIDDIQVGNGRTGPFFSFEDAEIHPDIIALSKSIGGGLPMSLLLIKPEYDQWRSGEHTGTFRGNNMAFVASSALLSSYWNDDRLTAEVYRKSKILRNELQKIVNKYTVGNIELRGKGLIYGLQIPEKDYCRSASMEAFKKGLVIETAGGHNDVLKFLPPLTIEDELLSTGLRIIDESIESVMKRKI